jgi:hypothetical protein
MTRKCVVWGIRISLACERKKHEKLYRYRYRLGQCCGSGRFLSGSGGPDPEGTDTLDNINFTDGLRLLTLDGGGIR